MKSLLRTSLLAVSAVTCLIGDVTYEQNVRYTGGTLLDMMRKMASNPILGRMGGGNLQTAFQDQKFTVYVKGSKMARIGPSFSSVYDLDAGTITTINNQKRTYSVMTFEEMRQQMDQMQRRANKTQTPNVDFDVKLGPTGQTRSINGQTASEVPMTLTAKTAGPGGQMVVKVDAWLVPLDPTMHEVIDYSKRLSAKFGEVFSGSPMLGAASAGIGAAMKEASKLDGYSVLTDIDVSGVSSPMLAAMGSANNDADAPLIKMEVQSSNFASGTIGDSKFAVPQGYTEQVHHGMTEARH